MALADIIERIGADAEADAAAITADAEARANAALAKADAAAGEHTAEVLAAARREAGRAAETIRVNARLAARDRAVSARRQLVDEALAATAARIAALPDAEYAAFLGRAVAAAARGGETLAIGTADAARADAIVESVRAAAPGLALSVSDTPAPFGRGVLLTGDRVRADLSLDALVAERRADLELVIVRELFGGEA